ncbi:hypothetical protein KCU67_g2249, partial [Aureobasidium melanogenum]
MLDSILLHWRALCILYGSLLASIAFSVGHHLYYQSLNNQIVSIEIELAIGPWAGVQSQKFNTAVGTTLASFFRTFLSITVTTAYCQIVWHALKAETTKANVVDAISGILANPMGFLNLGAWRKSALLLPLAIAIWLLPIAPIITPATLTVATNPQILQSKVNVTSIDFNSLNFAQLRLDPSQAELESQIVCGWAYEGPTAEVQKVVTAAAVPGAEILITAPGDQRNASYVQQFAAPALQCSDVTDPTDPVRRGLVSNVNTSSRNNKQSYGFVAWAPSSNNPLPFEPTENNEENQVNPTEIGPEDGPLTLFVATFPDNLDPYGEGGEDNFTDSSLIKCTLINATYSLSFSWTDSIQDLNVTVTPQNNISYPPQITCDHYLFTNNSQDGQALGLAQPLSDFNNTIIQTYAYASVLEAFSNLFKGTISSQGTSSSNVMNTIIGSTAELIALQNDAAKSTAVYGMQGLPPGTWPGVSASEQNNDPPSLRPTLELLFRNTTLRMMTSPLLHRPDPRTPYFPQPVENNMWHGFAAAAAASYARQLFFHMPLYQVKAKPSDEELQIAQKEAKRTAILNWLSLTDFTSQQAQINSSRHPKTGEWLLRSTEFKDWLGTTKQILFCTGMPGAGKTVMTSMVIDNLQRKFQGRSDIGIAYIYCNFEQHDERGIDRLLAGLLKQLLQRNPVVPRCVEDLYNDSKEHKHNGPPAQELVNPIVTAIGLFKKTFIILDALDECQSFPNSMLLKALFEIHQQTAANIFVTSRRVSHIERAFVNCVSIDIRARPEDLTAYIKTRLEELQEFVQDRPDLQNSVRDTIISAAGGVFLFARIQMDQLKDCLTPATLKLSLEKIPYGPEAYAQMYDKTLKIVEDQSEIKRKLAFDVLSWIFYSKRALTTSELLNAVAIEVGVPHLDQEKICTMSTVRNVCAGLVVEDQDGLNVQLVHHTAKDFMRDRQPKWLSDSKGPCPSDETYKQRLVENPFFDYAAWYWADHVRQNALQDDEIIMSFASKQANMAAAAQAKMGRMIRAQQPRHSHKLFGGMGAGHLLARLGLHITLKRLLEDGMHPDAKDEHGRTALYHAAMEGHVEVIAMLLQNKANVNTQGGPLDNALRAAAHSGHLKIVRILLDHKAVIDLPDAKDAKSFTAIRSAIVKGRRDVVRLLLERGAKLNPSKPGIETPLITAINHDRREIAKFLLDKGADPDGANTVGIDSPLVVASRMNRLQIARLLLEAGAAIDKTSGKRAITPLVAAGEKGHLPTVKVLLEYRPNVNMLVGDTKTSALLLASGQGFVNQAQTLLDAGASVNLPAGTKKMTPLIAAAEGGRIEVVKLLIERHADVNARDTSLMSALHHAATKGHIEIVKVLVQAGSSISNLDSIGRDAIITCWIIVVLAAKKNNSTPLRGWTVLI